MAVHRMTNGDLQRWLALGKGQALDTECGVVTSFHSYELEREGDAVLTNIKVRPIGYNVWLEPMLDDNNELVTSVLGVEIEAGAIVRGFGLTGVEPQKVGILLATKEGSELPYYVFCGESFRWFRNVAPCALIECPTEVVRVIKKIKSLGDGNK